MSQKTKGIYSLLSSAWFYMIFQKIMSGTYRRRKIVEKYIKKEKVKILDIGCGPAEILDNLKNVKYYGYDINPNYIEYAKKKYFGAEYNFYCKKFSSKEISKLPKFDFIILFGILHHLKDTEAKFLLKLLKKVLKKNGTILTQDPIIIENQNIFARFLIEKDRGENVRDKKNYIQLFRNNFRSIKTEIFKQKFIPYTWFTTRCKK